MKRIINYTKMQDGVLAAALIFLLAGCGFSLLQAFGDTGTSLRLIAPLFAPL